MDDTSSDPRRAAPRDGRPTTDDALLEHARRLIREGYVRRLWLLLVDADGEVLPRLTQIDDIPVTPEALAVEALGQIIGAIDASGCSVAVVLERPGAATPSPDDWAWHDVLQRAAGDRPGALRAVLLAHGGGIDRLAAASPPLAA